MADKTLDVHRFAVRFLGSNDQPVTIAAAISSQVLTVSPMRIKSQVHAAYQLHDLQLTISDTPASINALMQLGKLTILKSIAIDVLHVSGVRLGTHLYRGVMMEDFTLQGLDNRALGAPGPSTTTISFTSNSYAWQPGEVPRDC